MSASVLIGVALLGGLGSAARVLADRGVGERGPDGFPHGILAVNVTGSLGLGLLVGAGAGGDLVRLLGIGLLGGYTTYSAWIVDTDLLPRSQAVANVAISLVAGLAAVSLGRTL